MRCKVCICLCLGVLALTSPASPQWNEQALYSFQGGTDGSTPVGAIVVDKQGNIYGVTSNGGANNCPGVGGCGIVYQLTPPAQNGGAWSEKILHVFQGLAVGDGAIPEGGLTMDATGNLYGTTAYDGTGQCKLLGGMVGCGTVYEMSPPAQPGGSWTETVIYSFQGGSDGYFPWGDLIFDNAGNLYGATRFGGGKGTNCGDSLYPNCGTIFELSPPKQKGGAWTEKVLYSFSGLVEWAIEGDGAQPNGGLVFDEERNIYGSTAVGGTYTVNCGAHPPGGCGTAFELVRPKESGKTWSEITLYRFQGFNRPLTVDGAAPNGNLLLVNNAVYGTTFSGGSAQVGTFYSITRVNGDEWAKDTLYNFLGDPNPNNPVGGLTLSGGEILGTGSDGGANFGGALFRLVPSQRGVWNLLDTYDFGRAPAASGPIGGLVPDSIGNFYGITQTGGTGQVCQGGCGAVFAVWP